jgi:hypothetical protein
LPDAEEGEEVKRRDADLLVARQEGNRHRRKAEHEHRNAQLDAAPVPAIHRREDDRADRAGDEGQ